MASTYFALLDAVRNTVAGLAGLAGCRVTLRQAPRVIPLQDQAARQVIVASRDDLAELIVGEHWENKVSVGYEIFLGLVTPLSFDEAILQWRLDRRQEIRLALFKPELFRAAVEVPQAQYDVSYDPAPATEREQFPNLEVQWQKFTYTVAQDRSA